MSLSQQLLALHINILNAFDAVIDFLTPPHNKPKPISCDNLPTGFGLNNEQGKIIEAELDVILDAKMIELDNYNDTIESFYELDSILEDISIWSSNAREMVTKKKMLVERDINKITSIKTRMENETKRRITIQDWNDTDISCNPITSFLNAGKKNMDLHTVSNFMDYGEPDIDYMYSFLSESNIAQDYYTILLTQLRYVSLIYNDFSLDESHKALILGAWNQLTCNQIISCYLYLVARDNNREEFEYTVNYVMEEKWNVLGLRIKYVNKIWRHYNKDD